MRAAHQRSYFAPALFNLVPVETDLIGSMAVDCALAAVLQRGVAGRAHASKRTRRCSFTKWGICCAITRRARRPPASADHRRWNTAGDCEINDDLHAEGLPLPGDPPLPGKYGLREREHRRDLLQAAADAAAIGPAARPAKSSSRGRTAGRAHTVNGDSGSCRPTMGGRRRAGRRPAQGRARAARSRAAHRRDVALRR